MLLEVPASDGASAACNAHWHNDDELPCDHPAMETVHDDQTAEPQERPALHEAPVAPNKLLRKWGLSFM
ncbi:MAG: hypothetical protein ACKPKO_60195, partial [Candidatus Fonsibacter sp.]